MQDLALVVMAAGIGTRYGGLKQIDPVGPAGETVIDYSVFDALRAGFRKIVFVIRSDIEAPFRAAIGNRIAERAEVQYVFQDGGALPEGLLPPRPRAKPWGTGHAMLVAMAATPEPCAVINADDFYGRESFQVLGDHLRSNGADEAMVGFVLRNTLSEFGTVKRGACTVNPGGYLRTVTEVERIEPDGHGAKYTDSAGVVHALTGDEIVSMNMWGFRPTLFPHLAAQWAEFTAKNGQSETAEFYIPDLVTALIAQGMSRCRVLPTSSSWFGMTYREDRALVVASVRDLIARGVYPERLWA